ncbi:hypothetical protein F1847_00125 [Thermodesulfobacterium sp. TA1]|uniref:hypothetical protein n=1 Tax=Thermodesulfobacterium sp. TA1 TaxID=2234087 RepID=UPI001232BD64|nr:hypothetical protein [Thermodesulfobacterium sp. TA1]QER41217.1 hypothetical protein F1847_00125 [Thermodesulfobacterium sp. TA1]
MNYEEAKKIFLEIKSQIDETINKNGINKVLLNYDDKLTDWYNKVISLCSNDEDKKYINFNYYPCKSCISFAKNHQYKALSEWLEGLKNFIEYTNQLRNLNKWVESVGYYSSRLNYILQKRLEIFGNLPRDKFYDIIDRLEITIDLISPNNNLSNYIKEILITILDYIVSKSGEIYTEEHLERKERLMKLLDKFKNEGNYYIEGTKNRIKFILYKKELHYNLRKYFNKKTVDKEKIIDLINQMRYVAGREKNNFKKINNGERIAFKKFLSEIDVLIADYYNTLWIKKDLIESVKCLENIFLKIRKNLDIIKTFSMFQYFVTEYLFLQNYIKLLLVANDFRKFSQQTGVHEWQKAVSEKISNEIVSIAQENFKYNIPQNIKRSIFIIETSTAGKFLEFIIFSLLKELSAANKKNTNLSNVRDKNIASLLSIVLNSNPDKIKWSYKTTGTDIDILIENKGAIFIKSGIIGAKDRKKIQNELKIAEKYEVFYLLDIAKNLNIIKKLSEEHSNKIKIIDIGNFLNIIYNFAKNVGVNIDLSISSLKSLTGLYS